MAFVLDEVTAFAANPFPSTTAGAARQRWGLREIEFEAMQVAAAGLPCLMAALAHLPSGEPLRQEILRTPAHVLYLLHHGEGGQIVGAVLHGKPREPLPSFVRPMDDVTQNDADFIGLAADIVGAYVTKNNVPASELPGLITATHAALVKLNAPPVPTAEKPTPPILIRSKLSVTAALCV